MINASVGVLIENSDPDLYGGLLYIDFVIAYTKLKYFISEFLSQFSYAMIESAEGLNREL